MSVPGTAPRFPDQSRSGWIGCDCLCSGYTWYVERNNAQKINSISIDQYLATSTSVTLHRELLEAIDGKFYEYKLDDLDWPKLDSVSEIASSLSSDDSDDILNDRPLQSHWHDVQSRYLSNSHLSPEKSAYDLSSLPKNWAVLSISVTEDRNTMFISRHQNGHDPLVFCLPLDRQGKREGGDDLFTFDTGMMELKDIVKASDECSKSAKTMTSQEQKLGWWTTKRELDKRMKELINNVEYCWLGAFKVRCDTSPRVIIRFVSCSRIRRSLTRRHR